MGKLLEMSLLGMLMAFLNNWNKYFSIYK